jgi:hypothetical protein
MVATVGVLIATPAAALPLVLSNPYGWPHPPVYTSAVLEHFAVSAELERVEQRYQLISFVSDIVPKCPLKQLGRGSGPRRYCRQPATVAQWRNPQSHDVKSISLGVHSKSDSNRMFLAQNQTGADTSTKRPRRACVASGSGFRQGLAAWRGKGARGRNRL